MRWLYFSRGFPLVYYGDEQGFTGDGGDKDARQDMMPSQVASYNDDDLIGTAATTADDNFDHTHPLYQTLRGLRRSCARPIWRCGRARKSIATARAAPGIYAFSRIDRDEQVEYLVVFNNAEGGHGASYPR